MKTLKRRGSTHRWFILLLTILILSSYSFWTVNQPLPVLKPSHSTLQLHSQTMPLKLAWPSEQSAIGIVGTPIFNIHGVQSSVPIASTAKLITALCVLHEKPLELGQQGPTITLTDTDVAIYNAYVAKGGSVVQVAAGEQISEYQILEAMLMPSANNMADSLATWAFGSLSNYAAFADNYMSQLQLTKTHIGSDASGFDPSTSSTAIELVRLGEIAILNPVLAQIVGQTTATGIPVVDTVKNVNPLLGSAGIIGIKTGNTDQAGGVFVSAAKININNKPTVIVSAVIGAPTLKAALQQTLPFIQSAETNFQPITLISAGAVVGNYQLPWGGTIPAVASQKLIITEWKGSIIGSTVSLKTISAASRAGQVVGSLHSTSSALTDQHSVEIRLKVSPSKPSYWWRILHP